MILSILSYNIDLMSKPWLVFYTCVATFIVNLPFGYFRASYRKLSFMWFLMIHLAVPFVVIIRKFFGMRLSWELAPFLVGSFLWHEVILGTGSIPGWLIFPGAMGWEEDL